MEQLDGTGVGESQGGLSQSQRGLSQSQSGLSQSAPVDLTS